MRTFWFCAWIAVAGVVLAPVSVHSQAAIPPETLAKLRQRVTALEARIGESLELANKNKELIKQKKLAIEQAPQSVDGMIAKLETLIDEMKTGSETQQEIQAAKQSVMIYIDKFREKSPYQKSAAEKLKQTLKIFDELDVRRDKAVGEALAEVRRLKASKDDLVAASVVADFEELAKIYTQMIGAFEVTVGHVKGFNDDLASRSKLPTE